MTPMTSNMYDTSICYSQFHQKLIMIFLPKIIKIGLKASALKRGEYNPLVTLVLHNLPKIHPFQNVIYKLSNIYQKMICQFCVLMSFLKIQFLYLSLLLTNPITYICMSWIKNCVHLHC